MVASSSGPISGSSASFAAPPVSGTRASSIGRSIGRATSGHGPHAPAIRAALAAADPAPAAEPAGS